jgi:hypothetical protein
MIAQQHRRFVLSRSASSTLSFISLIFTLAIILYFVWDASDRSVDLSSSNKSAVTTDNLKEHKGFNPDQSEWVLFCSVDL